jgi:tetratricopeptide (TPR) repeat protein
VLAELTSVAVREGPSSRSLTRHRVVGAVRRVVDVIDEPAGVLLIVDDAEFADEATIDVLVELAAARVERLKVVVAYRDRRGERGLEPRLGFLTQQARLTIDVPPLPDDEATVLIAGAAPSSPDLDDVATVVRLAGGNPFLLVEMARRLGRASPIGISGVAGLAIARFVDVVEPHAAMLGRLAVAGDELGTTEIAAVTGLSDEETGALLDDALSAGVLIVRGGSYRFRHELVRQALIDRLPPHQRVAVHRDAARRLERAGAAPARIAAHWLRGERPDAAVDWLLAAARQAVRLGAFDDALTHVDALLAHTPDHADALCVRAEALDALGSGGAPAAYAAAAAAAVDRRGDIRAKEALAQLRLGDLEGARRTVAEAAPVTLEGRLARALARSGLAAVGLLDPQLASVDAAEGRRLALELGDPAAVVAASWAQALAAHARGELRESLRLDVRDTSTLPELAIAVFDGQLCVTERLLYGAAPYDDVIVYADSLAVEAERLGAARGRAFALTLRGEAELLAGRLADAERDLAHAGRLHQSIAAPTGEALTLQRRAEVALHDGRRAHARQLLDEALAVAHESSVEFHLLDRIYGTAITAAPDLDVAMTLVSDAERAVRGPFETCPGCRITYTAPAAIASARAGDVERAATYADSTATLARVVMQLPAWDATVEEVEAHLALACGDPDRARHHFRAAARGFERAAQPLDVARCQARAR